MGIHSTIRRTITRAACAMLLGTVAQSAIAASYGGLVIFGDSLSDAGNNYAVMSALFNPLPVPVENVSGNTFVATYPYASHQYSNGNVWALQFAASIGLPGWGNATANGGGNAAFGGARLVTDGAIPTPYGFGFPPSLATQESLFLGGTLGHAPSDWLYVVAGGGNDGRDALEAAAADPAHAGAIGLAAINAFAANEFTLVHTLENAGAQHIVVWNAPNFGLAPAVSAGGPLSAGFGTQLAQGMNTALGAALQGDSKVKIFDLYQLLTDIVNSPGTYNLQNVTDACGDPTKGCDPSTSLFWDGIHPTARGHEIIAGAMYSTVVPLPQSSGLLLVGMVLIARKVRRRS